MSTNTCEASPVPLVLNKVNVTLPVLREEFMSLTKDVKLRVALMYAHLKAVTLILPAVLFVAIVMLFAPGAASIVALLHPGRTMVLPVVFTSQQDAPFE